MANDWMAQGNCADKPPSLFFPSDGVGVEVAKRLCVTCAVRPECLEYALRNRIDHGVWGGTSERERRRILKSRRLDLEADLSAPGVEPSARRAAAAGGAITRGGDLPAGAGTARTVRTRASSPASTPRRRCPDRS